MQRLGRRRHPERYPNRFASGTHSSKRTPRERNQHGDDPHCEPNSRKTLRPSQCEYRAFARRRECCCRPEQGRRHATFQKSRQSQRRDLHNVSGEKQPQCRWQKNQLQWRSDACYHAQHSHKHNNAHESANEQYSLLCYPPFVHRRKWLPGVTSGSVAQRRRNGINHGNNSPSCT